MFKKRLITISALPFVTALLLGSSLTISNKPEKVSAINDTHEHNGWTGVIDELPTVAGDYYLTNNITLSSTWNVPEGTTNICLNGYVINANGGPFSVITVGVNAILNLYDCGDTSHNGYVDDNGLWHLGTGEGTAKAITGGIITGGNPNGTDESTKKNQAGGGVYVSGTFNMYGGTIAGNEAKSNGGGVFAASGGKFTMSAGEIIFNKASNGGGAATPGGTIEINSGIITDNNATNGGGVFNYGGSTMIMGGSICNNFATQVAGGVYQNGNLTLGGTTQIVGNTLNGVSNNFYQPNGKLISFDTDKKPSEDMKVGLTLENGKAKFTSVVVEDYSSNFFSDNLKYGVKYNSETSGGEYLELVDAYAIANNTKEADKATNNGYIEVKERAIEGEEVSINVVPNAGYELKSLVYYDGTIHDIKTELSFVMPAGAASVTATFEKTTHHHSLSPVDGKTPTCTENGYKEAWKCSECGQYFEDEACTVLIGDEAAYNIWKTNNGYLPQLTGEGLSGGAIAGICVGSIFFILLVIYLIGYFFLYRKGKFDEKKIKVIYKFLPRGEKNLKEDDK